MTDVDDSVRLPVSTVSARGVFRMQLVAAAAIASVGSIYLLVAPDVPHVTEKAAALAVLMLLTPLVAFIRWENIDPRWSMLVPMVDIVVIGVMRAGDPTAGFGVLLALPVCWLAAAYGKAGAIAGPVLATLLIWVTLAADLLDDGLNDDFDVSRAPALVSLPLALAFTSATIYIAHRRLKAQSAQLARQKLSTESALERASQEEYALRTVLDAVDFNVVQMTVDGRVMRVNRAVYSAMADLGLDPRLPLVTLPLYAEDAQTPLVLSTELIGPALDDRLHEHLTMWIGEPDGIRRAYSIRAATLRDRQGEATSVVIVGSDITAELLALQARDDLVASVSHELRTPLTSILGYLELAYDDESITPSVQSRLEVALRNTDHLMTLVQDLLTVRSRDPEAAIVLHFAEVELAGLISEAIEAIRPLAADHQVSVHAQIPHAATVRADASRLRQVLDNVLSNAVKYNVVDGTIEVTVRVPDTEPDAVEIRIDDTGRGMSPDDLARVFDRFHRASQVRGTKIHGTGLGMSIARDIVHRHGGTLEVRSELGVGTTVLMKLRRQSDR